MKNHTINIKGRTAADLKPIEFEGFRKQTALNRLVLSPRRRRIGAMLLGEAA